MRAIFSCGSVVLLLGMLSLAPFVHSHSGEDKAGKTIVHGHLEGEHEPWPLQMPAFEAARHDGQSVDIFASVSVKADPDVGTHEHYPALTRPRATQLEEWSGQTLRVRGPPHSDLSSRAPPA